MSGLESWARALLRCPACGAALSDTVDATGAATLTCDESGAHVFPVRAGIPVLLVDEILAAPAGE